MRTWVALHGMKRMCASPSSAAAGTLGRDRPLPSPPRRGGSNDRFVQLDTVADQLAERRLLSLSLRERAGVRGDSAAEAQPASPAGLLTHSLLLLFLGLPLLATRTAAPAATVTESFATNPLTHGWHLFGNTNLFLWDSTNQNLRVTWDSLQTNSYFYLPLGTILDRQDNFSVAFDLEMSDIAAGVATNASFPLAIGLINLLDATRTNFFRGSPAHLQPNLVEFTFFPDTAGYGPTIWPDIWSTNGTLAGNDNGDYGYTIMDLPIGVVMRITLSYSASNQTLNTTLVTNGVSIPLNRLTIGTNFTDFRVAAFAIPSYSDAGQNPRYANSILAHGIVDNVLLTVPPPPVQNLTGKFAGNQWQASFTSLTNWLYTLERTGDLRSWTAVSTGTPGIGGTLILPDPTAFTRQWYRVNAQRPY